jgi:hypothetical protein
VEVANTMGAAELVRKYLESDAGSDLLAEMAKMAAELLMDPTSTCSAAPVTASVPMTRSTAETGTG